jgi:pimeloyl-ACP methyl ester carboxylesterase
MPHLDHPVVSARYFFPRRAPIPDPLVVDVDGAALHCWHRPAGEGKPTLLHFHGNGEVVADYLGDFAEAFTSQGWGVLLAEYRGYGGSTGTPMMAAMLADAVAVFDAAKLDPARAVVYGRSVGSIYALEVASRRPVKALVLESGIANPLERILLRARPAELGCTMAELQAEASALFDHAAKLRGYRGDVVVFHTVADHMVDFHHGELLAAWSGGELVPLRPGDHNSILAYHLPRIVQRVLALG